MSLIRIVGAGPAGTAAAITALAEGCAVELFEKSPFPRHKVCGEFLSPEAAGLLDSLGVGSAFRQAAPATLRRVVLNFGSRQKMLRLGEPAYGLSRYVLDNLLLRRALDEGAVLGRTPYSGPATILARGRPSRPSGDRLFGFKAHFRGPVDDAVDLFFQGRCYVGVSAVENEVTNVCGLAPESLLRLYRFEIEGLVESDARLRARLAPLTRITRWFFSGPVGLGGPDPHPDAYTAGDTLGFVDPFTGSGITAALLSGKIAGHSAAIHRSLADHFAECRRLLARQYLVASIARWALDHALAEPLIPWIPGSWLFHATRPGV
ncbi:MAG: tryptophan 7-halogenase [Acidobacteria bacterium]|nr:tryptophan 7-halogenase [Acidobacteriota bacterium]